MSYSALMPPTTDPTSIFEHFRGHYATELLTVAVCHLDIFGRLERAPRSVRELAHDLSLQDRPAIVLTTALRAMGLLDKKNSNLLTLTEVAREHLLPGETFDVGAYIGLAAQN